MKTLDRICEELGVSVDEIAKRTGLTRKRVESIMVGRWTPSPTDRERIATALGVKIDEVIWGHTMPPRNLRYHRFGLKDQF
jgi:transcriptional regulator with XRE-family HTH domain